MPVRLFTDCDGIDPGHHSYYERIRTDINSGSCIGVVMTLQPGQILARDGNVMKQVVRLALVARGRGTAWCMVLPGQPKYWQDERLLSLGDSPGTTFGLADWCRFGPHWRRRSGVLAGCVANHDFDEVFRECGRNLCVVTNRRHSYPADSLAAAAHLPRKLAKAIALATTAGVRGQWA